MEKDDLQMFLFFVFVQRHEVLDMEDALELEKGLKPRGEVKFFAYHKNYH